MKNLRRIALSTALAVIISASMIVIADSWVGYLKPAFPDYAPSGMPDFDEKQDQWGPGPGTYTWCGPVAVANSLWWFDSKYESRIFANPVPPPVVSDHFPLVTAYGSWDDHDQQNVDPLVRNLAWLMDTDGRRTLDGHMGTRWQDLENGTKYYIAQQGLTKYFEVHNQTFPDFNWISNEVLVSQDVVLFLEFYKYTLGGWQPLTNPPSLEAGHFVTCAGVNSTASELLISDPWQDAFEAGTDPSGRSSVPHAYPHLSTVHNDAQYVSQDAYQVASYNLIGTPPPPPPPMPPPGYPPVVWELKGYLQTMGFDNTWHAFIRTAVATSPKAVPEWPGYIKPAFPDYAPSGMPDFDEKQDAWGPAAGIYTWCSPVAVANSLWWLDSEYESLVNAHPIPPPTISDYFNLVTAYGPWDDHDPQNVDPLVRNLASLMDTDGIRTHDGHTGTRWNDAVNGIRQYLIQQGMAGMFEVHDVAFPTFAWIENETEVCQDVEISLEFWRFTGIWQKLYDNPSLELGHTVTCAGVNSTASELLISDPWQDAFEAGTDPSGRSSVPHAYPHPSTVHNDAQYVSQDAYQVIPWNIQPPPPGYPPTVYELAGYLQTMGYDPTYHAFINAAVATSPAGVHDVAVTNVTTSKKGCLPMETAGKGVTCRINATVENQGTFEETFHVTLYANATEVESKEITLSSGSTTVVTFRWNTTGYAFGNYTIKAVADTVDGESDTGDNTFIDGKIRIGLIGDINADKKVDLKDVYAVGKAFGATRQGPNPPGRVYSPNCDINDDDKIDLKDYYATTKNFGKTES